MIQFQWLNNSTEAGPHAHEIYNVAHFYIFIFYWGSLQNKNFTTFLVLAIQKIHNLCQLFSLHMIII